MEIEANSLKSALNKYNIEYLPQIDAKLYLIDIFLDKIRKSGKYYEENKELTIHGEIKFIIKKNLSNELVISVNNDNYIINPPRRIINFIEDNNKGER